MKFQEIAKAHELRHPLQTLSYAPIVNNRISIKPEGFSLSQQNELLSLDELVRF